MDYTFYAFWNGEQIYDILNAVVLVTGGASGNAYRQLMTSVALIAFLVSIGVGLAKLRATDTVTAFMALTFFYGIFFVPTKTVLIDDVRNNQQYVVANVPLGLALFGSMTSKIGYFLTTSYENNFTSVDDEKFSTNGFLFGNRLIEELPNQEYSNPVLRGNLGAFSANCILPELADYPQKLNGLVSAPDVWQHMAAVGWLNEGRVTPYVDAGGASSILDCEQAMTALGIDTLAGADRQLKYLSDRLHPGGAVLQSTMAGQLTAFESAMLGINRTADKTIRHYAVINMIKHSAEDSAGIAAATFAAKQLETSYFTMKTVAEGALPKLRNLVEALVYAVFPIVFLLVIAAGAMGGKVLSMYAMAGVWIHLWAPLYAVINSFMHRSSKNGMLQIAESAGGTIENLPHLLQMTVSDQGMAGLMVISVPAIALAIVKGGAVAMSGVVNSLMSPAQSAAARVGSEMGMGNVSGAKVNWGGASYDSSVSLKNGFSSGSPIDNTQVAESGYSQRTKDGVSITRGPGGQLTSVTGTGASVLQSSEATASHANIAQSGREVNASTERATAAGRDLAAALEVGQKGDQGFKKSSGTDIQGGYRVTAGDESRAADASTVGSGAQVDASVGQKRTTADEAYGGVGAGGSLHQGGAPKGGGSSALGKAGLVGALSGLIKRGWTHKEADSLDQALKGASSTNAQTRQEAQDTLKAAGDYFINRAGTEKSDQVKQAMRNFGNSLKDTASSSEKLTTAVKDAETAKEGVERRSGGSEGTSVSSTTAAVSALAMVRSGNTGDDAIFEAFQFARNSPSEANAALAGIRDDAKPFLDNSGGAPVKPDELKEGGNEAVDGAATAGNDRVKGIDQDFAAQTNAAFQSALGITPDTKSGGPNMIAAGQTGVNQTSTAVASSNEQTQMQNGAVRAATAAIQADLRAEGEDFKPTDLNAQRVGQRAAQIMQAAKGNQELQSLLKQAGSNPNNDVPLGAVMRSGGAMPADLRRINELAPADAPQTRPGSNAKFFGQVPDVSGGTTRSSSANQEPLRPPGMVKYDVGTRPRVSE